MRHLRFAAIALALFVIAGTALAGAATHSVAAPNNLRGFLLRLNEPLSHTFSRTPAFAWSPVHGARCYQFEVGTSKSFTENSLIWSNVPYVSGAHKGCPTVPAISIDTALPWFTGAPYALYAHVRAVGANGATRWSKPFGFNVQWQTLPSPMASQPGLVRWTPVEGATGYQVWYTDTGTPLISTNTNVADEREYYTFHPDASFTGSVHWRVRAVRKVFGTIPNGLPAVSYGPWSKVFTASNPEMSAGNLALKMAISDQSSTAGKQSAHELMPALTFSGTSVGGRQYALWRAYAFTDRDCVNVVYRGSVVGGPAYAPRTSGPLKLPMSDTDLELALTSFLPSAMTEGDGMFSADGSKVEASENILGRMPVVRPIYKSLKQIFETLFSKSGSSFRRVGLVEFPSPGMWSLVFLSNPASEDIAARLPDTEHIGAFMPCTPNPTTGFFFYVPRRSVIDLDISVEAAMTLLMSAGLAQPGGGDQQKKLAALAETARIAAAARPDRTPAAAE